MNSLTNPTVEPLRKPAVEWRQLLSGPAYKVLFEEDTERRNTSPLYPEQREGTYVCAACFLPLFTSDMKYESGTGWPSFYDAIPGHLETKRDRKLFVSRTEYHCARCGGHQGHVFHDGPPPTGKRYCNNGLALKFIPGGETLPYGGETATVTHNGMIVTVRVHANAPLSCAPIHSSARIDLHSWHSSPRSSLRRVSGRSADCVAVPALGE